VLIGQLHVPAGGTSSLSDIQLSGPTPIAKGDRVRWEPRESNSEWPKQLIYSQPPWPYGQCSQNEKASSVSRLALILV
jgi:hypothetical protein